MRALLRELFETVVLALFIFLALHLSVQNFLVQGPSMRPTLDEGEYVLVNKLVYMRFGPDSLARLLPFLEFEDGEAIFPFHPPRRGEVVIFRFPRDPERDFVKRVVGEPGDTVEIRDGRPIVNGLRLDEPYIAVSDGRNMALLTVPAEMYFVMGDNRRVSLDSRDWGPVPADHIIGRAWVSFWPLTRWHALLTFR